MTRTCIRLSIVKLPLLKYDKQQDCEHSNTNESNSIQHLLTFCSNILRYDEMNYR